MDIRTKYITSDDFKEYFGIDLVLELKSSANPSDTATAFLKRIEDRMESFLNANFFKLIDDEYIKFTDEQKIWYQKALLEQAIYVFKNGDISVDSGLDYDGEKISKDTIMKKTLAPNAMNYLKLCGLWTRHIGRRGVILW